MNPNNELFGTDQQGTQAISAIAWLWARLLLAIPAALAMQAAVGIGLGILAMPLTLLRQQGTSRDIYPALLAPSYGLDVAVASLQFTLLTTMSFAGVSWCFLRRGSEGDPAWIRGVKGGGAGGLAAGIGLAGDLIANAFALWPTVPQFVMTTQSALIPAAMVGGSIAGLVVFSFSPRGAPRSPRQDRGGAALLQTAWTFVWQFALILALIVQSSQGLTDLLGPR